MKGVIYYYSATGNTELACRYIAKCSPAIEFDLFDITKTDGPDPASYDFFGFAAPTDHLGPPYLFRTFLDKLPAQNDKPAFVFNTYGLVSGRTLAVLKDWADDRGFKVVAGHSLRTPENYPPLIVRGIASENAPGPGALKKFNGFIAELNNLAATRLGKGLKEAQLKLGFFNSLLPARPRDLARTDMGNKFVDDALCVQCGACKSSCPYGAIELNPKPAFDMEKCYGCWSCFNHCPHKAIYTAKVRGKGHYPGPGKKLREKLNPRGL